jgi:hypothetical protein
VTCKFSTRDRCQDVVRFAIAHRRDRVLGGPSVRTAFDGSLSLLCSARRWWLLQAMASFPWHAELASSGCWLPLSESGYSIARLSGNSTDLHLPEGDASPSGGARPVIAGAGEEAREADRSKPRRPPEPRNGEKHDGTAGRARSAIPA